MVQNLTSVLKTGVGVKVNRHLFGQLSVTISPITASLVGAWAIAYSGQREQLLLPGSHYRGLITMRTLFARDNKGSRGYIY